MLSGSVGKAANLGVPDIVLSNMSDVVDHCRRITRMAAVSLMVDAEDGFGNAVNVRRTVQEMEAAGVSAIEIEDNLVPKRFNVRNPGLVSKEEQGGQAASGGRGSDRSEHGDRGPHQCAGRMPSGRGLRPHPGVRYHWCGGPHAGERSRMVVPILQRCTRPPPSPSAC